MGTNDGNNDDMCVVCLSSNGNLVKMCEHHCGNLFHKSCWNECMKYDKRCPMCRRVQFSQVNRIRIPSDIYVQYTEPLLLNPNGVNGSDMSPYLTRYFGLYSDATTDIMIIFACLFFIFTIIIVNQMQHA